MKKTYNKPSVTIKFFDVVNSIMSDYEVVTNFRVQTLINKMAI